MSLKNYLSYIQITMALKQKSNHKIIQVSSIYSFTITFHDKISSDIYSLEKFSMTKSLIPMFENPPS